MFAPHDTRIHSAVNAFEQANINLYQACEFAGAPITRNLAQIQRCTAGV